MVFRLFDHLEVNLTRLFCPVVLLLNTMLLIQTVTSVDVTLSSEMFNVKVAMELFHLKASWKKQNKNQEISVSVQGLLGSRHKIICVQNVIPKAIKRGKLDSEKAIR